ncbi:hypothetical protein FY528_16380 [Hymenobacter lutimineralis]|uniref:Uncharacterized protein n=1 Tax=Hymenobacter lutimineralis TaxID=2606448 RepID=A0A5D6UWU3_9BACT|nr:hypothetical protein [Hymenobacter lutimineralis]TYZ07082.1 hypothetical protein FY528_16380 [Hymenobacter lutimineralis]
MSKHKEDKQDSALGPDAIRPESNAVDPETRNHSGSGGNQTQNLNQNFITQAGNQVKNNTPGGNAYEQRHSPTNKPRNNPQGNWPMSVDKSQKGPGRKAD